MPWIPLEASFKLKQVLFEEVQHILSPNVIKDLPDSWQCLKGLDELEEWLEEQKRVSYFYAIQDLDTGELIGLLFFYSEKMDTEKYTLDLRLGYLLKELV